jgi:hypothetical protein
VHVGGERGIDAVEAHDIGDPADACAKRPDSPAELAARHGV